MGLVVGLQQLGAERETAAKPSLGPVAPQERWREAERALLAERTSAEDQSVRAGDQDPGAARVLLGVAPAVLRDVRGFEFQEEPLVQGDEKLARGQVFLGPGGLPCGDLSKAGALASKVQPG